ncbi:hypothetical protein DYB32_008140 [Aphanomyces invadans]|uniref:Uncharacterized protein n=1 Tax=Aphanomyces invadans TaxID=157072 RepID=A0A418AM24_9STRA|nr:hypothetical protein DYB32_008140 [Aphanomyces invadans]
MFRGVCESPSLRVHAFLHWFLDVLAVEQSLAVQFSAAEQATLAATTLATGTDLHAKEVAQSIDDDEAQLLADIERLEKQHAKETRKVHVLRRHLETVQDQATRLCPRAVYSTDPTSGLEAIDDILNHVTQWMQHTLPALVEAVAEAKVSSLVVGDYPAKYTRQEQHLERLNAVKSTGPQSNNDGDSASPSPGHPMDTGQVESMQRQVRHEWAALGQEQESFIQQLRDLLESAPTVTAPLQQVCHLKDIVETDVARAIQSIYAKQQTLV